MIYTRPATKTKPSIYFRRSFKYTEHDNNVELDLYSIHVDNTVIYQIMDVQQL